MAKDKATTGSEKDRVKRLRHLLDKAKDYRKDKGYDAEWKENLEWFKGNQHLRDKAKNDDEYRSNSVTNFLFSQLMSVVPILANRMPQLAITPISSDPESKAKAEKLMELNHRIMRHNDFIVKQTEHTMNMLLFNRGFYKPVWSGRMRGGVGDVRITVPDTRAIYKDKFFAADSNWIFECREIDKLTLYQMYPHEKTKIERIFRTEAQERRVDAPDGGNTGEVGYHAGVEGDPQTTSEAYVWDVASGQAKEASTVEIVEAWFIDETTYEDFEKIVSTDPSTGEKKSKKKQVIKKKYPTGRLITFAGNEILDDRPNPFPAFPYIESENYFVPGEVYGHGELDQLKPIQEQYNIRSNQVFDALNFATFPMIFYDYTSGLEPGEIVNMPGGMYPVDDIKGITRFDPTGIAAGVFQSLPQLEHNLETVSGIHEVNRGAVPGDVRSGFAIEQLQESAQSRLRLKTRNMEYSIKNLGRYLTRMIGLYYEPGVHYDDTIDLRGVNPDLFDFEVKAGVNLPGSRIAQQQLYQWMYMNQIVDEEFIVDQSDIPNKDELVARMKDLWAAKRASMSGGAQPAPGVPIG